MQNPTQNILRHWRDAVPNDRLAHLIRDTERAFRRALQIRLAPHGVPFGHWAFLRILWESDGLSQKELSDRAGVMEPTTFAAMKAMEVSGYITRRQLPSNKKNVYVYLTDAGRALKEQLVPLAEETNQVSTDGVSAQDLATARKVLLALIANLARDELGQVPPQHATAAAPRRRRSPAHAAADTPAAARRTQRRTA
jgi:MarR family transcriptional regulator, organic hydroperoxide resistance regulator